MVTLLVPYSLRVRPLTLLRSCATQLRVWAVYLDIFGVAPYLVVSYFLYFVIAIHPCHGQVWASSSNVVVVRGCLRDAWAIGVCASGVFL